MAELNWDDLRILLAVAETGSLSAAAIELRLSQPTIGRRIRALELSLGLRIIDKVSNRIELSPAGQRIIAKAGAMTAAAAAVTDEARLAASLETDPVHVTATGSVSLFLTDYLATLHRDCGGIPLQLSASRTRANLQRRDADIALRMRRLPTDGDLVARRLCRIAFSVYAPQATAPETEAVLIGLPQTDKRPSQAAFFDDWAAGRPVALRISDVAQRYRAISAGGIGLLPCWLGDLTPGLQRLVAPPAELQEDLYLMIHRNLKTDRRIKAVAASLTRLFKARASVLAGRRD